MTHNRFDASASRSRASFHTRFEHAKAGAIGFRIVRLVWLTARFARHDLVTVDQYRRRFGTSVRSFHRDIGILREAGFEIAPIQPHTYRTICFTFDSDQAQPL